MQNGRHFWKGWIRVRLESREPERFFNLCAFHKIELWNLIPGENGYECSMMVPDFFRIQPLCRKSGSRLRILKKHGMPFFYQKSKKRKAFLFGILLFGSLLFGLSRFVWNIHVTGNVKNSTGTILDVLEEQGISHGISKSELDCSQIASFLREAFPDITWVSVRIRGTELEVEIKENVDGYSSEPASEEPVNLVASKDGTVLHMITRSGVPKVLPGQSCKKGDLLVEGQIPLLDDNGEIFDWNYVHADADVELITTWYYYDSFPLSHTVRTYEKEGHKWPLLQIGPFRLETGMTGRNQNKEEKKDNSSGTDELRSIRQLYLTENFALPIYYGYTEEYPFVERKENYQKEEALAAARDHYRIFQKKITEKGLQILENHVTIECKDKVCMARGTLQVVEQAVKEQPVEEKKETNEGKDFTVDE